MSTNTLENANIPPSRRIWEFAHRRWKPTVMTEGNNCNPNILYCKYFQSKILTISFPTQR